jgi:hypothetical protein
MSLMQESEVQSMEVAISVRLQESSGNVPLVPLIRCCPQVFILLLCGHGVPSEVPSSIALDKVDLGQDEEDDVAADDADKGAVTAVAVI